VWLGIDMLTGAVFLLTDSRVAVVCCNRLNSVWSLLRSSLVRLSSFFSFSISPRRPTIVDFLAFFSSLSRAHVARTLSASFVNLLIVTFSLHRVLVQHQSER
jgi:hypothetical protein